MHETDAFTSNVISKTYNISHKLNCDGNCLIYLFPYKCFGKQFIGETTDSFRYRWNDYKDNNRKHVCNESCMQEHFLNILTSCRV